MPRRDDLTNLLQQPASLFDQRVLSKFMTIRPKVLGILEISIGTGMIVLTMWTGFLYLLWSCLISVLTGFVTVSAACKRNSCWARISQLLNSFNAIAAVISISFHSLESDGVTLILLVVCDVLDFIISVIVTSSSCECCRTQPRHVAVSYINRDAPYMTDNIIVLPGQQGPFAPPPNYDLRPSAPPAYYNTSPSAPPPNYDAVTSAPPPNYDAVTSAPPPSYDPGLFEPPPSYNQVRLHLQ